MPLIDMKYWHVTGYTFQASLVWAGVVFRRAEASEK